MHELGIMYNIVEKVLTIVKENHITSVETLVLQVGEISSVVPRYLHACYPAATDGTILENTKLEIEILPANAICKTCKKVYNLLNNQNTCPYCNSQKKDIISGEGFFIKELRGY